MSEKESNKHRLPTNTRPIYYNLHFWPNLTASEEPPKFSGYAQIDLDILRPTREIILNAAELTIIPADVTFITTEDSSERFFPEEIIFEKEREAARIVFREELPPGLGCLHVFFTATHNDNLVGFYRSQYTTSGGEKKWLVTTQFEATDARRAFPCWDEPDIKAKFRVTLQGVPQALTALSNMPIESESVNPATGLKTVTFVETPKMSTYLLAFIVGEFERISSHTKDGVDVGVWTLPGKTEQGKFALDVAVRSLEYMTDYFGISYPLPKLDNIVAPDFAAGAMENWGAVTYRETALLVDPVRSAETARQRVATVVAHELAHQWFGNLVTMKWWTDLWLNEGFASWMGDKVVNALFPDWDMWTIFVAEDTNRGLALDGLKNTHPIEVPVNDTREIGEIFDAISYSKGAAMIRMLEDFLGEETFRNGLRLYLKRHLYGNAETKDLWQALEEVSDRPVREMMEAWTLKPGYPVIEAKLEGGVLRFTQSRFLYDRNVSFDGEDDQRWDIPVNVSTDTLSRVRARILSSNNVGFLCFSNLRNSRWVKVNADQTGFYRVNYDAEGWRRLIPAVASLALPPRDRLGIESDAYALQKASYLPATQFLEIVPAYRNETELAVWSELASHLGGFENLLVGELCYEKFRKFAGEAFDDVVHRMGWEKRENDRHADLMLRSLVLGAAGGYGSAEIIREAKTRFTNLLATGNIDPDLRGAVYGLVAQEGGEAEHDALVDLYKKATLQEEKVQLLRSLGGFRDLNLVRRTLQFSLSPDVRSGDLIFGIAGAAANSHAKDLVWEFAKENWSELTKRLSGSKWLLRHLVEATTGFRARDKEEEVREFFTANPVPEAKRTIEQSLERIRLNARWLERNREDLNSWFSKRVRE